MTCRRICRELLWSVRFGELDASSQPHLEHLAACSACRDEVGFDREMVRQLRRALAERVDGMVPSPTAWEGIVRRTQAPPSRWASLRASLWSRSFGLVGRLRTATAMAGTGLALMLALNTQVAPIAVPASTDTVVTSGGSSLVAGGRWPPAERSRRADAGPTQDTLADPQPLVVLPPPRETLVVLRPAFETGPGEVVSLDVAISSPSSVPKGAPEEPATEAVLPAEPVPTELARPS